MDASYCLCGQPYDPNIFMIQCDACKDWFHSSCCNFQEHLAVEIDKYHCPRCAAVYGPSIFKPYRNCHRHDYWDENATNKSVQTGTPAFIRELRARHFCNEAEVVIHLRGQQLTEEYFQTQGFSSPIVIDSKEGLEITIPPDTFTSYDIEAYVGGDLTIDVIDVTRQSDLRMKLRDYVEYFNSLNRTRIFNVVSLEFSNSGLAPFIEAPLIARKLDWVNTVWPKDFLVSKPQVQKYCLISVKDSYTDFHIDFGGTSVWYHILRGEKIFYFIKPTIANLTLYQQWMTSTNQCETFFGDQVDQCFKCTLRQGQTMLIPTGWIHAVLTPIDSIVFGGNFLHSLNIPMQLTVYEIEKKIKVSPKFKYPNFEMICWFAADSLYQEILCLNGQEMKVPNSLLVSLKALLASLKQWNTEKDYNTAVREQIPFTINSVKLLKDISKEIRHAERYINLLNPPKPERESKRKRKRPINKDFDYSLSPKTSYGYAPEPLKTEYSPIKLTIPKPLLFPYQSTPAPQPNEIDTIWNQTEGQNNRPEKSTAIHRGGAVLKIKLGSKDIIPPPPSLTLLAENSFGLNSSQSIYDFHDDSEREEECNFTIDESPKKFKRQLKYVSPKSKPGKVRKPKLSLEADSILNENGIESLLKASVLSTSENSGHTSPSTQEAIVGMLSISQTYLQQTKGTKSRKNNTSLLIEEENINNVHQDDEYIYPSLDNSDDEDVQIFKPRGRAKVDEAWNPKARLGPLLPKMNRPAREGTRKQAVEKVLEAAAAKRANESPEKSPKRQYRRKKLKPKVDSTKQEASTSTGPVSATSNAPSTSGVVSPSKPKKGMKTVKQRLGKILKIHKMIH